MNNNYSLVRSKGTTRAAAFLTAAVILCALIPAGMASAAISSWQKSISIYPHSPTDFGSSSFDQTISQMKALGFNYVTLIIPYYQSNIYSTDIGPAGNAPTDASLVSAIQYVHSQGMSVILKIHLDPGDGNWRASINPSDRTTWFANYKNVLLKYAAIAKQNSVEEYCIGTELISMSSASVNPDNTTQWQNMISAVRAAYSGKLFYDANWGGGSFQNEPPQIGFWGSLDYIGISAYYNLGGDGSVASLVSDWDSINSSTIQPLENQFGKPILFSEIGYRSVTNAHLEPWNSGIGGAYNAQEQVNDYTALFQYWNNYSYLQGVGIWYAVANPNAGGSGDTDYLIQNKPVDQTIAQWFTSPPSSGGGGSSGGSTSASFTASAVATPASAAAGQAVTLTASIADQGAAATGVNIDVEVYNAAGTQVFQKVFTGQNFSAGQAAQYSTAWVAGGSGTYTLKVGVFSGNWSTLYAWNNSAATIQVGSSSGGTGGTSGGAQTTDIWWPASGASVSGIQPFKALVENLSLSQYAMYWQVDGGALNPMQDSTAGGSHKEAMVDLSHWTWRGSGPYTVNFVSKDGSGTIISQKSVQIYITQ
jgi:hypothetical protein